MIEFLVDREGITRLAETLEKMAENARDAMEEAKTMMLGAVTENFEREGGDKKWKPLSPSTVRERKREGFVPIRMLYRTGALLRSIKGETQSHSALLSTSLPYAHILHHGGRAGRRRQTPIPPRPFLTLREEDTLAIREAIARWISKEGL